MTAYIPAPGDRIAPDTIFKVEAGTKMTIELLQKYLSKHQALIAGRYGVLHNAYMGDYPILHQEAKDPGKPDNRIVVNFAKFIVDTFNGFFMGQPIKVTSPDEAVDAFINELDQYNDQDDNNTELSKICSIYGKGYEYYWIDENSKVGITYLSPMEAFMVYDYSLTMNPVFFVTVSKNEDGNLVGSVSTVYDSVDFSDKGGLHFLEETRHAHNFQDVPASEYIENEERMGVFEPVYSVINAYNKAISEKANDVDYFADSYLEITGPDLEKDDLAHIRQNRIINTPCDDAGQARIQFLQKPSADEMQENLIDRLAAEIYAKSMVMNITDENFSGQTSGIALKYKLFAMSNLAKTKERKFTSSMNRRYKVIFGSPACLLGSDAWASIEYRFTQNYPANTLEEAQTAAQLAGIVSQETQLAQLSCVTDVQAELQRIKEEQSDSLADPYADLEHLHEDSDDQTDLRA